VLKHGAVLLGATVLLFLLALDGQVTRIEGLVLISAYVIYVISLMNREKFPDEKPGQLAGGGFRSWSLLIVGLGAVTLSSEITVTAVVNIAYTFELSEALISVLIIGLGTSLPELSISISAIMKKKAQLSVGNIVGSNILDTLLPIGIAAVISEMTFERQLLYFDLPFIFVLTTVVLALLLRKQGVARTQGLIILGFYFSYVFVKLMQF
jgi:cation:H+ antiporter